MANELRYVDPVLAAQAGITITATLSSMTTNRASQSVVLAKVKGGFAGNLPPGLIDDIYAVRYLSNDGQVDAYEEIQTTLTPIEERLEHCIDVVEADETRTDNVYRKFKRGTTQALVPAKTRTINGNTVEIRE